MPTGTITEIVVMDLRYDNEARGVIYADDGKKYPFYIVDVDGASWFGDGKSGSVDELSEKRALFDIVTDEGGGWRATNVRPSPAGLGPAPLLEAFNPASGDHFYTTSLTEHNNAVTNLGYKNEGAACHVFPVPGPAPTPLLRAFNPASGDHFYTTSVTERDNAVTNFGYKDEGVACYVFPVPVPRGTPLLRTFNPATGDHFYTISPTDRDKAVTKLGYTDEGVACYV